MARFAGMLLVKGEDGQAMVEYGVILATLVVGLAAAVKGLQLALAQSLQLNYRALADAP